MPNYELKLPKMGESVAEATITGWLKEVGDAIEEDEAVLEIATDKVDSEVPSEVDGILKEKLFDVDDTAQVGDTIAIIETDDEIKAEDEDEIEAEDEDEIEGEVENEDNPQNDDGPVAGGSQAKETRDQADTITDYSESSRFYSPLVKNIAQKENIGLKELEQVKGTGKDGRVTKNDILAYVEDRKTGEPQKQTTPQPQAAGQAQSSPELTPVSVNGDDEIFEMSRMGKMVAKHMTNSKQTAAHVQSFIEVDVTKIWNWRQKVKAGFQEREGEKFTFTPIFMEAVAKAIKNFPMINISVNAEKEQIIKHKSINLGMATALADGNLIVPVIRNADQLNLTGMAKEVNRLAKGARNGQLSPDATSGGTYTVTNVGAFGSIMGTPIINQPQVAILALGAIRKVPAVIESPEGDSIGIRYKMFLSHSYDHRVINGAMGGQFIKQIKDYLENFDDTQIL